ncbi:MAG: hypothetical protein ACI4TH_00325, partial [Candidatus Ornithomonoglobus sp.]
MWYLETDTLVMLLIATGAMLLFSGITRLMFKKSLAPHVLIFANIAVIGLISWQLLAFSVGYMLITYILVCNLRRRRTLKKTMFVVFSLLCTVPFFYGRMHEFFPQLPVIITFIGIAYHMLRAIDALYFVYYTDMRIPFLAYANYMLFFPT